MNRPTPPSIAAATAEVQGLLKASAGDDGAVVRLLDRLLQLAHEMRASDLHFEPYEQRYRVRMRIDGQLHDMDDAPLAFRDRLAARIKVMARLDVAEKRLPQDGRIRLPVSDERLARAWQSRRRG